jgi:hypothetical protein
MVAFKPEEIGKTLAGFNAFHPIGRVGTPAVVDFLLSDAATRPKSTARMAPTL